MTQTQDRIFTRNFAFISIGSLSFSLSAFMTITLLSVYIKELGGSPSSTGLIVGGASLVFLAVRPFTGILVDSWGRRPLLMVSMALIAVGTIGYDFATNVPLLWVPRLVSGAGAAVFITASGAYIADIASPTKRGETIGYYGLWGTLGHALGPPLALWLASSDLLSPAESPLERWLPGRGSDAGAGEFNFALAFVVSCAAALVGLGSARSLGEVYKPVKRARQRLWKTFQGIFDRAGILPGVLLCLMSTNSIALNVFIPLYGRKIGVVNPGLFFTFQAAAVVAVRLLGARLLDRYPRAYYIIPALGLSMVGTVLIGVVQEGWMLYLGGLVVGAGQAVAQPSLTAFLVDQAPKERVGRAIATFNIGTDLGLAGGGYLMGLVLQLSSFTTMFFAAGLSSGLAAVILTIAILLSPTARRSPAAAH